MQGIMKVHHQFARGFWDQHEHTSLTLGCKRLRPLAPKLTSTAFNTFELKSFIRPESDPIQHGSSDHHKKESPQAAEAQPGGTRWNPTQEQIEILEMLYRGGMRTPNANQIEQITSQLSNYGKIEGKNVFYWFQNHKARERQKQKRNSTLTLITQSPTTTPPSPFSPTITCILSSPGSGCHVKEEVDGTTYKRKCSSWAVDQSHVDNRYCIEEEVEDRTLKLFPLHPEGRS